MFKKDIFWGFLLFVRQMKQKNVFYKCSAEKSSVVGKLLLEFYIDRHIICIHTTKIDVIAK